MELTPVENLLTKKGIEYKSAGKDYVIKCLNPDHDDTNPSLRVDKVTGVAHCFSCGWKKNLFKYYGIFSGAVVPVKVVKLKEKIRDLVAESTKEGLPMPEGAIPYIQAYRGISPATFRKFEAFYTHSIDRLQNRIVFPVKDITGKTVAYIGRHVDINAERRYEIFPGGVQLNPYPALVEDSPRSIFLVEGLFDLLNMYDKGLRNTICAFGVNSLMKDTGKKLLSYKVQNVSTINIMFDGDEAGRQAATQLQPLIEEAGFSVNIVHLPDDTDPGSLSQDILNQIKETYK